MANSAREKADRGVHLLFFLLNDRLKIYPRTLKTGVGREIWAVDPFRGRAKYVYAE